MHIFIKTIKRQQAKLYRMRCRKIKRDSLHLSFCSFFLASSLVDIISNYDEISHLRVYRICYYRAYVCCACLFNQVKLMINILILYSIALKRLKGKKLLKLFIKWIASISTKSFYRIINFRRYVIFLIKTLI